MGIYSVDFDAVLFELLLLAVLSALESDFDDESVLALESDFESVDEPPLPEVLAALLSDDELESELDAGLRA